ncbi:MAG: hypothetical protein IJT74_08290 [Bacteroidales bacterium]|nr:hypothetical protein [Bacteroidales bacterium]
MALNPLVNYGTQSEIAAVGSELMAVVGDDGGSYRGTLSSPQDAQMKAGCEAIQNSPSSFARLPWIPTPNLKRPSW